MKAARIQALIRPNKPEMHVLANYYLSFLLVYFAAARQIQSNTACFAAKWSTDRSKQIWSANRAQKGLVNIDKN